MNRQPADAMFGRIASYAPAAGGLIKRLYRALRSPRRYQPGAHYMRGPGPKWREKHAADLTEAGLVKYPVVLGDKWDF
jgi:hypothetical protein